MRRLIILLMLILTASTTVHAQVDQCDTVLQMAIAEANENCADMPNDSVCYGAGDVSVETLDGSDATSFTQPADSYAMADVGAIVATPLESETENVGIAIVKLAIDDAANSESIVLILIGDVVLENLTEESDPYPYLWFTQYGTSPACGGSPSGILIQTPAHTATTLTINGADMTFSSTVFLRAPRDDNNILTLKTIEGSAQIGNQTVLGGFSASAEFDPENSEIMGDWTEPELFDDEFRDDTEFFDQFDEDYLNYDFDIPDDEYLAELETWLAEGDYDYEDLVGVYDDGNWDEEFGDESDFIDEDSVSEDDEYIEADDYGDEDPEFEDDIEEDGDFVEE